MFLPLLLLRNSVPEHEDECMCVCVCVCVFILRAWEEGEYRSQLVFFVCVNLRVVVSINKKQLMITVMMNYKPRLQSQGGAARKGGL